MPVTHGSPRCAQGRRTPAARGRSRPRRRRSIGRILREEPEHWQALHYLGLAQLQQGRTWQEAERPAGEDPSRIQPRNANAWSDLGTVRVKAELPPGRPGTPFSRALELDAGAHATPSTTWPGPCACSAASTRPGRCSSASSRCSQGRPGAPARCSPTSRPRPATWATARSTPSRRR